MFDGILGQERPKALLAKLLDETQQDSRQKDRIGCAYLFAGPQGTGKKLMALEFIRSARAVSNWQVATILISFW